MPAKVVTLQQEWIPFSGFAGEAVAASDTGPKLGVSLKLLPGSEAIDSIKSVLSGRATFGVVAGDLLISAIQKGAPLVAVGVVNDTSPTCFLSRKAENILKPNDFLGKRVGILTGTNTEKIYEVMLRHNNVDRSKINEMSVPFELGTFIAGQYDVRPAFIYDEPVTLAKANIPINIMKPSDFGVNFIGTVYFTRRSFAKNNRPVVLNVVEALVRGWREVAEPGGAEKSIKLLKSMFPEIDEVRELESLRLGLPYFLGPEGANTPLMATESHWQDTIAALTEIGAIPKNSIRVVDVWDNSFVLDVYAHKIK